MSYKIKFYALHGNVGVVTWNNSLYTLEDGFDLQEKVSSEVINVIAINRESVYAFIDYHHAFEIHNPDQMYVSDIPVKNTVHASNLCFFSTAGTLGLLNFDNGHIITEQLHSFSNMLIVDFMVEYKREFYEITLLTKSFTYNSYCLVRAKLLKENDNWGFLVSDITALFSLQSMLTYNINRRLHCMTIVNEESNIFFYHNGKLKQFSTNFTFFKNDFDGYRIHCSMLNKNLFELSIYSLVNCSTLETKIDLQKPESQTILNFKQVSATTEPVTDMAFLNTRDIFLISINDQLLLINTRNKSKKVLSCSKKIGNSVVLDMMVQNEDQSIALITVGIDMSTRSGYFQKLLHSTSHYRIKASKTIHFDNDNAIEALWITQAFGLVTFSKKCLQYSNSETRLNNRPYMITPNNYIVENTIDLISAKVIPTSKGKEICLIHRFGNRIDILEINSEGSLINMKSFNDQTIEDRALIFGLKDDYIYYYLDFEIKALSICDDTLDTEILCLTNAPIVDGIMLKMANADAIVVSDAVGNLNIIDLETKKLEHIIQSKDNGPLQFLPLNIKTGKLIAYNEECTLIIDLGTKVFEWIDCRFRTTKLVAQEHSKGYKLFYLRDKNTVDTFILEPMKNHLLEICNFTVDQSRYYQCQFIPQSIISLPTTEPQHFAMSYVENEDAIITIFDSKIRNHIGSLRIKVSDRANFVTKLFSLNSMDPDIENFERKKYKDLMLVQIVDIESIKIYLLELLKKKIIKNHGFIILNSPINQISIRPNEIDLILDSHCINVVKILKNEKGEYTLKPQSTLDVAKKQKKQFTVIKENNDLPLISPKVFILSDNILYEKNGNNCLVFDEVFISHGWSKELYHIDTDKCINKEYAKIEFDVILGFNKQSETVTLLTGSTDKYQLLEISAGSNVIQVAPIDIKESRLVAADCCHCFFLVNCACNRLFVLDIWKDFHSHEFKYQLKRVDKN